MCACRVQSSPSTPVDLEDYYQYLETDMATRDDPDDVYAQLAQKEKDLILAAELGKALLDKNEELQRRNEILQDEYSQKIEELEQEKYAVKLRLETIEGEYENTVKDLQTDVSLLRKQLEEAQKQSRDGYRNKSLMVEELTSQNERLTEQLRSAVSQEDQLSLQLSQLRNEYHTRRSSMHQHIHHLEVLREEISVLTERNNELERRIKSLEAERSKVLGNYEESQNRIHMLEKENHEKEQQIRNQQREIDDLKEVNNELQERMEELSLQASNSTHSNSNSLFSELEMSNCFMTDQHDLDFIRPHSAMSGIKLGGHACPMSPSPGMSLDDLDDDIECDDDDMVMAAMNENGHEMNLLDQLHHSDQIELRQEVFSAYKEIHKLLAKFKENDGDLPQLPEHFSQIEKGNLLSILADLEVMLEVQPPDSSGHGDIVKLQKKCEDIQDELNDTRRQMDNIKSEMKKKDDELKRKSEEFTELNRKVTIQELQIQHDELTKIQKERDDYEDKVANLDENDIVAQARKDRDDSISKRNSMEIELATAKLDLMALDQQLMEAIQQKIELSQQLEQWQIDMQDLLESQMQKRIEEEIKDDDESHQQGAKRGFSFWN